MALREKVAIAILTIIVFQVSIQVQIPVHWIISSFQVKNKLVFITGNFQILYAQKFENSLQIIKT